MCWKTRVMLGVLDGARDRRGGQGQTQHAFVRMARQVGFDGYDDFREPFRDAIRRGAGVVFPDRVRWLQDMRKSAAIMGGLYADMVGARSAISKRLSPGSRCIGTH